MHSFSLAQANSEWPAVQAGRSVRIGKAPAKLRPSKKASSIVEKDTHKHRNNINSSNTSTLI